MKSTLFTDEQIYTEMLKQFNWLNNKEVKQKEFTQLHVQRCEPYQRGRHFYFMGTGFVIPELLYMDFHLTNDHIVRGEHVYNRKANFSVNQYLN